MAYLLCSLIKDRDSGKYNDVFYNIKLWNMESGILIHIKRKRTRERSWTMHLKSFGQKC